MSETSKRLSDYFKSAKFVEDFRREVYKDQAAARQQPITPTPADNDVSRADGIESSSRAAE